MAVLGGMYCYPGGTVTESDSSQRMMRRCTGLEPERARKLIGAGFNTRSALAFWVAAIRELFEAAGLLLTTSAKNGPLSVQSTAPLRPAEKHRALVENSLSFVELLEGDDLTCDLSRLGYFSRWQTPAHNPVRFDTRFFIAALPSGHAALAASPEVAHGLWLTPDRAMQLHERRELPMTFPTFAALRTLADSDTLESVAREYGLRTSSNLARVHKLTDAARE